MPTHWQHVDARGLLPALRAERLRQNISMREMADRLGVGEAVVSHWECGRRQPSTDALALYARGLCYRLAVIPAVEDGPSLKPPTPAEEIMLLRRDPVAMLAALSAQCRKLGARVVLTPRNRRAPTPLQLPLPPPLSPDNCA